MTAAPSKNVTYPEVNMRASGRTPHRYTLERYHNLIESGFLTENDKVELIFGQLIDIMPIGQRHEDCVDDLVDFFNPVYRATHRSRVQNSVSLAYNSEPEPDFALVNRGRYDAHDGKPVAADVDLLIEVSDSTLEFDRSTKATMYALAGIKEYWIINLRQDVVEVHTDPDSDGGIYNAINRYAHGVDFQSPFCGTIRVADLIKV